MVAYLCKDAADLIEKAHWIQQRPLDSWLFRGHGDANWRLIPGLLRDGLHLRYPPAFEQWLVVALRKGLHDMTNVPDRFLDGDMDESFLLPLAQHYGAPTRLLDWTKNPLVACWFAATDALKTGSDMLTVFAVGAATTRLRGDGCRVILPYSGANQNAPAQSSTLILHDWKVRDYWADQHDEEVTVLPEPGRESEKKFFRLNLPSKLAERLIAELLKRGLDATRIFPGMHGQVALAVHQAWANAQKGSPIPPERLRLARMPHSIAYYGHIEHSFDRLHATQDRYWAKSNPDGDGKPVEHRKDPGTGIEFGFLETSAGGFVIAKVDEIILRYPIPHIRERHGGKGVPVHAPSTIDDDAAIALLSDAIAFNPELRPALVSKLRSIGG